jgi:hypothetical protein
MPVRTIGAVAFAATVLAGPAVEALPCDDLARRLDGQPASALRALWRQLGVSSGLFADVTGGALRAVRDRRDPHVIVTVTSTTDPDWQYLVFTHRPGGCRFVGAVDAPTQILEPPSHRLVILPGAQTALAVRAAARSGTGLALVREPWYLLAARRLSVVLDYPVRGHLIGWPSTFDRSFAATARPRGGTAGVDEVQIEYRASYTSGSYIHWMPVEPLFTSIRTAYYAWRPALRRYVLDPVRSDVADDEIEGLFHDAESEFLQHNVQELAQLAGRAGDGQRTWLRHFLDPVPDGPEKRAVMENLR